ncbi:MAG: AAA family ATPase [Fimbriimonas sp.]
MLPPIFVITGPPAAGKSTISRELMQRFEFGIHIPVDDLREWVVSGIAHPIDWSEETTRQFSLAEQSAADLAIRYNDSGFAVAIDHCCGPPTLDDLIASRFEGRQVVKVVILPSLEVNLQRNRDRTGKNFDPELLTQSIHRLYPLYASANLPALGWNVLENSGSCAAETSDKLLSLTESNLSAQ